MESTMTESKMMGMMGMPAMGSGMMGAGMGMPSNMMMVPRCTMTMEMMDGGMKVMCSTEDQMAMGMMQNLCSMMSGGMVSMCMMMNGMMVMNCNMMMGMCKFEMTADGMMMTCTSGDEMACMMIQSCCTCMMSMMQAGCTCYMCMNGMPICCG